MIVYLIRHGKTAGNQERRYIGRTDESLCTEGIRELEEYRARGIYPLGAEIYTSPMKRCIETAKLLYPNGKVTCIPGLQETDFGIFEGSRYDELKDKSTYQSWLDSGGELPFPEGESKAEVLHRSSQAFERVIQGIHGEQAIFIIHGGIIMALLEKYGVPYRSYYDYQVKNGDGYKVEVEWKGENSASLQLNVVSRLLEEEEG